MKKTLYVQHKIDTICYKVQRMVIQKQENNICMYYESISEEIIQNKMARTLI